MAITAAMVKELRESTGAGMMDAKKALQETSGDMEAAVDWLRTKGLAKAAKKSGRIAAEAARRWPLSGLLAIHRHGLIRPGENIVLVVSASSHRQAAFEAASFLMDYLKTDAPFWKREHRADGTEGGWVEAREEDDEARARWSAQPR